ncbi:hypothetical protein GCM10022243_02480 [Saccharothrix violaceirubra]|uniref:Uncharacterized protein n=1 Tax=Saccharothrix violaceirubra TaxID=413306 RepID=A0A7W7T3V2_9PSEU|nr:hypothetical protein [Saccharothrix violaceirubra]
MNPKTITWSEAVELFERRGLPKSTWENLYEGEYVLYSGDAVVTGDFPLNSGEPQPWDLDYDIGYIVDGSLTVSGALYDFDDGAAALVVLGDLRATGFHTTCDTKLVVTGNTSADVVYGRYTDKYLVFGGDLRATVQVWWDECAPDQVDGTLAGSLVLPSYASDDDLGAAIVENAGSGTDLLVAEVLGEDGVDGEALLDRLVAGEPVLR